MTRPITLVQINPGISFSTDDPPPILPGVAYNFVLRAQGGVPGTYTIVQSGTLPTGIVFTDYGDGTATISGTTTQGGAFPILIDLSNGGSYAVRYAYTLVVPALVLHLVQTKVQFRGVAVTGLALVASGGTGTGYTYNISAGLPAGCSYSTSTGVISGTPTTIANYSLSASVTDSAANNATTTATIIINSKLSVKTYPYFQTELGRTYASDIILNGVTGTVTFTTDTHNGITLDSSGHLSGTSSADGTVTFNTTATDSGTGDTLAISFPLKIRAHPWFDIPVGMDLNIVTMVAFEKTFTLKDAYFLPITNDDTWNGLESWMSLEIVQPVLDASGNIIQDCKIIIRGTAPATFVKRTELVGFTMYVIDGLGAHTYLTATFTCNNVGAIQPQKALTNIGVTGPQNFNFEMGSAFDVTNDGTTTTVIFPDVGAASLDGSFLSLAGANNSWGMKNRLAYNLTPADVNTWYRLGSVPAASSGQESTVYLSISKASGIGYHKFRIFKTTHDGGGTGIIASGTICEYELLGGYNAGTYGIAAARIVDGGTNAASYLEVKFLTADQYAMSLIAVNAMPASTSQTPWFAFENPASSQGTGAAGTLWLCGQSGMRRACVQDGSGSATKVFWLQDYNGNWLFNNALDAASGSWSVQNRVSYALTPASATTWYRIGTLPHPSGSNGQEATVYINVYKANGTSLYKFRLSKTTKDGQTPTGGTACEYEIIGAYTPGGEGISNARVVDGGTNADSYLDVQFVTTNAVTVSVLSISATPAYADDTAQFVISNPAASQGTGAAGSSWACGNTNRKVYASDPTIGVMWSQSYAGDWYIKGQTNTRSMGSAIVGHGTITSSVSLDFSDPYHAFTQTDATNHTVSASVLPANPGLLVVEVSAPLSGTSPIISWGATFKGTMGIPKQIKLGTTQAFIFYCDGTTIWYLGSQCNSYGSLVVDHGTITTAVTLDLRESNFHKFTETSAQNPTVTMTPGTFTLPCDFQIQIVAPATGTSPTITWPGTFKGSWPTTVTLAKTSLAKGFYDGTNFIYTGGTNNY